MQNLKIELDQLRSRHSELSKVITLIESKNERCNRFYAHKDLYEKAIRDLECKLKNPAYVLGSEVAEIRYLTKEANEIAEASVLAFAKVSSPLE